MEPAAPTTGQVLADVAERALWTYVQAFIVALLGSQFFDTVDLSLVEAAAISAVPAALTVLLSFVSSFVPPASLPMGVQVLGRVARTGGVVFLGYLVTASEFSLDPSLWRAAAAAAGAGVLAAVKSELATFVGDPTNAATLPLGVPVAS